MEKQINTQVIEIKEAGAPQVLTPSTRTLPPLAPKEVLINIQAAGINRPDILQRKGLYPPPKGASDIPGLEVAGVIQQVGSGIEAFNQGDRVMALVTGGGYAQHCIAPVETLLPMPDNISFIEAAAVPETFYTVWNNVFLRGKLKQGETLLVHGGTSGIGTTAIMLAKAFGADVITTCGSEDKCAFAKDLGADLAINYKTQDFEAEVLKHTNNKGVEVVFDMVAGDYTQKNISCLAFEGRLVVIAFLGGITSNISMVDIMRKQLVITGSTLRASPLEFKQTLTDELWAKVLPLLSSGQVKPQIYKVFPLAEASKAHELMETSRHLGKIVLDCT